MAGTRRTDLLGRLADISEEAIQRLGDAPGGDKIVGAMNSLKERTDDLQKRVRGLEDLDKRLTAIEAKVDELTGADGSSGANATRKSTKTTTTKSSGGTATKKS